MKTKLKLKKIEMRKIIVYMQHHQKIQPKFGYETFEK